MQMSLIRLCARDDILGFVLKLVVQLLQFYSDVNQIYMCETIHYHTYKAIFIFILCCLEPFQIVVQLWCDWDILGKVAQHHSPGLIVPSEALGTIILIFILFFWGLEPWQLPYIRRPLLRFGSSSLWFVQDFDTTSQGPKLHTNFLL